MDADGFQGLTELCLAGQDLTVLSLIEYGSSIRKIDLSYNMLVSLRGLHVCAETLEELVLDNNMLERLDFRAQFPHLHTLSLNKNNISDMDNLMQELKARVTNLRHISLLGNPVCPDKLSQDSVTEKDYQNYRYYILHHLPNIRFIDSRSVSYQELKESRKSVYSKMRLQQAYTPLTLPFNGTRRATDPSFPYTESQIVSSSPYPRQSMALARPRIRNGPRPVSLPGSSDGNGLLPVAAQNPSNYEQKGKIGKRKFRYVGKHSEGNRFIVDSDL